MELVLQETGQFATLASILGGFAFTVMFQMLALEKKGKLISAAAVLFALATLMFLVALIAFVLIYGAMIEIEDTNPTLETLGALGLMDMFSAIYVLLAGIGLAGWIRSKAAGIFTTIFAVAAICLTGWAMLTAFKLVEALA